MNSFDEIQCEENPNEQLCFNMEEMAFMQEWEDGRKREFQEELDNLAELMAAELDF